MNPLIYAARVKRPCYKPLATLATLALLLFAWTGAKADSDGLWSRCSRSSSGTNLVAYACQSLSIGAGETITLQGRSQPAVVVTVQGDFTAGAGSKINVGGLASNLTLIVGGLVNLGTDVSLTANLFSSGVVTTGARSTLVGNLQTASAAINVGDHSSVSGNVTTTVAGVINIGADSTVNGDLTTASGAINVGDRSTINGAILSSVAGAVTLGANVTVTGTVATTYHGSDVGAGAITIGTGSEVKKGMATHTGAVTIAAGSKVCGNVVTNDGAITVGANASVCNSVCTGNSGAITVGAGATVGGNVETSTAGAITVGTGANVTGAVNVKNAGAKTIVDGATVGTVMLGGNCITVAKVTPSRPKITARAWRQIFMR
jgi:hypothetical protein